MPKKKTKEKMPMRYDDMEDMGMMGKKLKVALMSKKMPMKMMKKSGKRGGK